MRIYFLYAIIGLLIFSCFIPMSIPAIPESEDRDTLCNLFWLQSYLDITWNRSYAEKPITPGGEIRTVPIEIRFGITRGPLGDYVLPFFYGRQIQIHLETVEYPEWCHVVMKSGTIITSISREEQTLESALAVNVDKDAPAFQWFVVVIKASVNTVTGPFGLIDVINGFEVEDRLYFRPDYVPLISIEYPNGYVVRAPPDEKTKVAYEIINQGNGKTRVTNEIVHIPDDSWNIYMPEEIILDSGEHRIVNISIRPPYISGEWWETIQIASTPMYAHDYSLHGPTESSSIVVYYP
jgi:hypothetical protein